MVRVYANISGMDAVYFGMGIAPQPGYFGGFVRGFNMADAMCDYVDAGNGKECADEKVKGESAFPYLTPT